MVLHLKRVAETCDARKFCPCDAKPSVRGLTYDLGSRNRFAGIHTRSRNHYDRSGWRKGRCSFECMVGDIQNISDRVACDSNDLNLNCIRKRRMMPLANANDTAHVEQMQAVAGLYRIGHVAHKTFQGAPLSEHAEQHVVAIYLGETARRKFEIAVGHVFGQGADRNDVTGDRQLVAVSRHDGLRQVQWRCRRACFYLFQ